MPTFDNARPKPNNHTSPEITVRQELSNDETCINPGTIQEGSPETFTLADELGNGTETDHYMEPDAETN